MNTKNKIGIIGCGNMGSAILEQCLKLKIGSFIVSDKDSSLELLIGREFKVEVAASISDLIRKASTVIIAVKPQDIDLVLQEILAAVKDNDKDNLLVISIAAGIPTAYLENKLTSAVRVIRAMPNMPAKIGEGITALIKGGFAGDEDLKLAKKIFDSLGITIEVSKESLIDAMTAISGSGPAYIFYIFAAMESAAKALGINEKDSEKLVYQTIVGSMHLLEKEKFEAEKLISKVASKGGTTEAALKVFADKNLEDILQEGIRAAHKRAQELSRR